jgi:hypothetical protein
MNVTTYGLDVAKRVCQMYWVDAQTGDIVNRRFGRDELLGYLALCKNSGAPLDFSTQP